MNTSASTLASFLMFSSLLFTQRHSSPYIPVVIAAANQENRRDDEHGHRLKTQSNQPAPYQTAIDVRRV